MGSLPHIFRCHDLVRDDLVRAEGAFLYDKGGQRYADFESGIWCTALGHNHPRILWCVSNQIHHLMHLAPQYTPALAEEAACALLRHTPLEDGKVVFLSSGSEAVELAIRLASLYTGRDNLLAFNRSIPGSIRYGQRTHSG